MIQCLCGRAHPSCTKTFPSSVHGATKAPRGTDLHELADEVLGDEKGGLGLVPAKGQRFGGCPHIPKEHNGAVGARRLRGKMGFTPGLLLLLLLGSKTLSHHCNRCCVGMRRGFWPLMGTRGEPNPPHGAGFTGVGVPPGSGGAEEPIAACSGQALPHHSPGTSVLPSPMESGRSGWKPAQKDPKLPGRWWGGGQGTAQGPALQGRRWLRAKGRNQSSQYGRDWCQRLCLG